MHRQLYFLQSSSMQQLPLDSWAMFFIREGAELAESILTDGLIKKWLSEVDVFFK